MTLSILTFVCGLCGVSNHVYYKADVSSASLSSEWIRSDEGLALETSAFESLYGG